MTTYYVCKRCGAESPTGIGYVSDVRSRVKPAPDCPNPHTGTPEPVTIKLTHPRTRNRFHDLAEYLYLDGWDVKERVAAGEINSDELIKRLSLMVNQAKELDRLVKNQRRQAIKAMKANNQIPVA